MNKRIFGLLLAMVPVVGMSSSEGVHLDHVKIDLNDQASLQRGAKYFFNYCVGCHSLQYMRYQKIADGLGVTEQQIRDNLMFRGGKMGDKVTVAMDPKAAAEWFGTTPPDLSLIVRARKHGADWLYSYLRGFYLDPSRPLGVNNIVFPDVGMPHVLAPLQGWQEAEFEEVTDERGNVRKEFTGFKLVSPGTLTPAQYDAAVGDLVAFLAYTAEPVKQTRQRLGIYVLLFLAVFFVIAYALKKEYWKDVH